MHIRYTEWLFSGDREMPAFAHTSNKVDGRIMRRYIYIMSLQCMVRIQEHANGQS